MGDLISRKAVLEIVMQYCPDDDGSCSKACADMREMLDEIEALAAVDAVEVVRCKDCEFATDIGTDYLVCGGWGFSTDHNGCCYRGAKMNKEEPENETAEDEEDPDRPI